MYSSVTIKDKLKQLKTTMSNKRKNPHLRQIADIWIKEFKKRYPNLDVHKLTPTKPAKMDTVNLSNKRMANLHLHPVTVSVVCGTLLGDAAVDKSSKTPRIHMRHSSRQTDWFLWKTLCALGDFVEKTSVCFQLPDGKQKEAGKLPGEALGKWKMATLRLSDMTSLLDIIAPGKKKVVERSWLNHMNDYFLMTFWLDDGSLTTYGREAVFCVNNLSRDEADIIVDYLYKVWDVKCIVRSVPSRITNTNLDPIEIALEGLDNTEKFLRIVAPIIPVESMLYKVCFCPLDRSRQQRWASELKGLVRPEWHDTIDKYINYQLALNFYDSNTNEIKLLVESAMAESSIVQIED
jgi:hypothetical protein